ncbi:MAG: ATP-binding protein [Methylobacter sp.]
MSNQAEWMEMNDKHLAATVAWIRLRLERLIQPSCEGTDANKDSGSWFKPAKKAPPQSARPDNEAIKLARLELVKLENNDPPPALILLANALGLSEFDRQVLALCAAMELDTRIAGLCAKAQNNPNKPYPTFALAFALFDDPGWNALAPNAPLRYWRLLEINQPNAQTLTSSALCVDERILNYLKGLNYLDDRLTPLIDAMTSQQDNGALPLSQQQAVDSIIGHLKAANGKERMPFIELLGHDSASKQLIAVKVANSLGLNLHAIDCKTIPGQTGDFETFTRLWQRESVLLPLALFISVDGIGDSEKTVLKRFLERSSGVVFLDLLDSKTESVRNRISFEISKPSPEEQQQLWTEALQGLAPDQTRDLPQRLAEQFSFNQKEIKHLAKTALHDSFESPSTLSVDLWQACRIAARAGMEQLATPIAVKAEWEQLVLPLEQKALLQQITEQVARRNRVYDAWGFREKMNRGLGINALFAGESGTGKTMAAEVIANELQLDLFRIDLSAVVNKYIGETEKNLRKLFDAAEDSGAILFFDEADALFGKRSEVKDSHDRYANIEINYLLQRMESYRGLAILATNMKSALDKAFMRRLRFIVDFPFPAIEERKEIWRKVFPAETPVDKNLDYQRLASLNMTGGSIQNMALNAAFLAAQYPDGKVTMPLILNAARMEFKKLERPAKESDFRWLESTEAK